MKTFMRMMLFAFVAICQYSYHWFDTGSAEASWEFYVIQGIQGLILYTILAVLAHWYQLGVIVVMALAVGAYESSQHALCGFADWKDSVYAGDLCMRTFGPWPYAVLAATGLCYIASEGRRKWLNQQQQ